MEEKNIFDVRLILVFCADHDDFPHTETFGKCQLEILKDEKREKILKFTKRN